MLKNLRCFQGNARHGSRAADHRTGPLQLACSHQSNSKWLFWHSHYSFSRAPYVTTILKITRVGVKGMAWNHCQMFSFNNDFQAHHPTGTLNIFQVDRSTVHRWGRERAILILAIWIFLLYYPLWPSLAPFFWHSQHPALSFSPLRRPETDLQQLSKSGMTDKLIFSSWVYIPGICTADLALTSAGSVQAVF